jgi:hypothetical protein
VWDTDAFEERLLGEGILHEYGNLASKTRVGDFRGEENKTMVSEMTGPTEGVCRASFALSSHVKSQIMTSTCS